MLNTRELEIIVATGEWPASLQAFLELLSRRDHAALDRAVIHIRGFWSLNEEDSSVATPQLRDFYGHCMRAYAASLIEHARARAFAILEHTPMPRSPVYQEHWSEYLQKLAALEFADGPPLPR